MSPGGQAHVFLAMALCGAGLGAVYDALRFLRGALGAGRAATGACDLLFGALAAAGMTLFALRLRVELLRWYEFAGAALGALAYACTLGELLRGAERRALELAKKWRKKAEM